MTEILEFLTSAGHLHRLERLALGLLAPSVAYRLLFPSEFHSLNGMMRQLAVTWGLEPYAEFYPHLMRGLAVASCLGLVASIIVLLLRINRDFTPENVVRFHQYVGAAQLTSSKWYWLLLGFGMCYELPVFDWSSPGFMFLLASGLWTSLALLLLETWKALFVRTPLRSTSKSRRQEL